MSQKSILSFFKQADTTPSKKELSVNNDDVTDELKRKKFKRVKQLIQSDDEEEEQSSSCTVNTLTGELCENEPSKSDPLESNNQHVEAKGGNQEHPVDEDKMLSDQPAKIGIAITPEQAKSDSNKKRNKRSKLEFSPSEHLTKRIKSSDEDEDANSTVPVQNRTTGSKEAKSSEKKSKVSVVTPESKETETKEANEEKSKQKIHSFFMTKTKQNSSGTKKVDGKNANLSTASEEAEDTYDPSKSHYHPISDACWKSGQKVPYLALAKTLELIENISGRLKIVEILANFFRSVMALTPDDLLPSVYLCLNRLAPEYEGVELGIGETVLMRALAMATGRTVEKIKTEVATKGDLGLVAETSRGNQRLMFAPPKLTVTSVFLKFKEIAQMSGNAVMTKKVEKIHVLFVACRSCEARYIIRSLSGKLRIGLAEQSVLTALARAAFLTPPAGDFTTKILNASQGMSADTLKEKVDAHALILKSTYSECPNYDMIIPILLNDGIENLPNHCSIHPGVPLKPMLAHPAKGIDEVMRRMAKIKFTCEFKYDGERAQIHMTEDGSVKIYSRNQENNTSKYPDVIARISKAVKDDVKSFILDTEAVAWNVDKKQILPFQVLSTRKRKDAVESEIVVQVCIMAFDLLFLNGESLIKKPMKDRRELLHNSFIEVENEFMFAKYSDGETSDIVEEFLKDSIEESCEGLIVKSLEKDATYEIAKRSHSWLKVKKDYIGIGDTFDLLVIGGYHGKGKRTGSYGGFLLACYDDENEEFQSICKIGTGFDDSDLETHTKFFKQHVIPKPKSYYLYDKGLEPDEWFEPVQLWEVKCADLSVSPVHKAAIGIVDPEKGISLRFPRFLRIREDKKIEDCTHATQVAEMYESQDQIQNQKS